MNDYYSFYIALGAAMCLYKGLLVPPNKVNDVPFNNIKNEYDFIVIGAGSAGCVVASRLSEVPEWNILLIEAGEEQPLQSEIPLLSFNLINSEDYDWKYRTAPQANACLANGGKCIMPRGKMLGGTSSINAMVYLRGHRQDYDEWEAQGNPGWGWERARHYFSLSENNTNPKYREDLKNHGINGPMTVSESRFKTKLGDAQLEGGKQMGFQVTDLNGEYRTGFMQYQGTLKDGVRESTNRAYLRPAGQRPNLHVAQKSMVKKVEFDGKRAARVVFEKDGKLKAVDAKKEIIMSAGTIGSAQLLMVSGIGPTEILEPLDIPVVADLPVGKNLKDHLAVNLFFTVNEGVALRNKDFMHSKSIFNYVVNSTGPLSMPNAIEVVSYLNATEEEALSDNPDIELVFFSYDPEIKNSWNVRGFQLRPKSVGQITIISKDPSVHPIINPNYLDNKHDFETTVKILRYCLQLSNTPAMAALGSKLNRKAMSNCQQEIGSKEFEECIVKHYSISVNHQVGTCRMHKEGVVDHNLKIHGLDGIRVIDASIMPEIISSNTNAPTIMIAEVGSDLIKASYGITPHIGL